MENSTLEFVRETARKSIQIYHEINSVNFLHYPSSCVNVTHLNNKWLTDNHDICASLTTSQAFSVEARHELLTVSVVWCGTVPTTALLPGLYTDNCTASLLQGVPQNMSDLVFWIFNPLKCITERKYGQFWKAEDLTIPKHPLLF